MCLTDYELARVRNGEILHLRQPHTLRPLIRTIATNRARTSADRELPNLFPEITDEQFGAALATAVEEFDSTRQHSECSRIR